MRVKRTLSVLYSSLQVKSFPGLTSSPPGGASLGAGVGVGVGVSVGVGSVSVGVGWGSGVGVGVGVGKDGEFDEPGVASSKIVKSPVPSGILPYDLVLVIPEP